MEGFSTLHSSVTNVHTRQHTSSRPSTPERLKDPLFLYTIIPVCRFVHAVEDRQAPRVACYWPFYYEGGDSDVLLSRYSV